MTRGDSRAVTMRLDLDPRQPCTGDAVLALIRSTSGRGDDPFFPFRACLSRADEANPSFAAVRYEEGSLTWDEVARTGAMTLVADWLAIHGCSDWSCTGRQSTRVDLRRDGIGLVLSASLTPEIASTHEEF